jgi:beta-lactamase regulating signal transducer with metallopeptidase domain/tetratricopeptide (TPR) repeat protein
MNLPTSDLAGLVWSQIWQVTALATIVGLATRLLCRRRPHLAYVLWMLVVLKCLTPPLWSSPTGLFSWAQVCSAPPSVEGRLPTAVVDAAEREAHAKSALERMLRSQKHSAATPSVAVRSEAAKSAVARVEPAAEVDRSAPPRRSYLSWTTVAAAVWLLGVFVLAGNWLWKWIACSRLLHRSGVPANEELELLAARTAERLGMRRAIPVRVVSEGVGPAVFGLWRPVVVIPRALVAGTLRVPSAASNVAGTLRVPSAASNVAGTLRVPSASSQTSLRSQPGGRHTECACYSEPHTECAAYLAPILAHELIHVRRGDAYVGLLQMIAQVLWWFHPLVWWMNREMCRRREQCCDEEAVAGMGCSGATYARCLLDTLELELQHGGGRRRLLSAVPGTGSAEVTTMRLEHIMDDVRRFHRRTPRWIWGVLAMAMLLVLPGRAIVLGEEGERVSTKDTKGTKGEEGERRTTAVSEQSEGVPTLAEIAKANDAAWAAIRSFDVEFTRAEQQTERILSETRLRQTESTGRWLKDGNRERLRQNSTVTCQAKGQKAPIQGFCYDEYYLDGATVRHVQERARKSSDRRTLSIVDPKPRDDLVGYIYKGPRAAARGDCTISEPEVLRHFRCRYDDPPLTLAEIIAAWKVTLKGKTTTAAKETLWRLRAERPVENSPQTAGTYIDFYVNADKGFLVQKAVAYVTGEYFFDNKSHSGCHSREVKEFQSCGSGVFFPKRVEYRKQIGVEQISADTTDCVTFVATKLSVNAPLAGDAFDFRFPAGLEVGERDKNNRGDGEKVYIWGADNKPAQTFASETEYCRLVGMPQVVEEMRQRVEKKIASKKPEDLMERGEYYIFTQKYDEAIATFTQWLAADPKPERRVTAAQYCGMTYLFKEDYDKAVVNLTEAMRVAEELDNKDAAAACANFLYCFRGIAYASRDNTLDKAMDDLSKVDCSSEHTHFTVGYWAPLFRTALRLRHVDFGLVGQNRAQTGGKASRGVGDFLDSIGPDKANTRYTMTMIFLDLQGAMGHREGPEAYAMMIDFLDKLGDHESAAKCREAAKRNSDHGTAKDGIDIPIDDAFQKCFARLAPEIAKEAQAIQKTRAARR